MTYLTFLRANARWLAGGFLLTGFSGFGQTFYISLSSGHLRQEFGLSHGDFGLLYMLATLGSALSLPWVGRSVDVFPVRLVAVATCLSLGIFCLSMSAVNSVFMLFVVIFGLRLSGQGMMTHVSMTAMGRWYSAQRGRAVSVSQMGFPVAESLLPASFVVLSAAIGWRTSWAVAAAIMVFAALPVISLLFARERTPQSDEVANGHAEGRQWTRGEALRDPMFWVIVAGVLAPPFIGTAILFNQVYLTELRGWPLELFASTFVAMAAAAIVTSLTLGPLIDRYSAKNLVPVMLLPLCTGCLVLALAPAAPIAFVFMTLLGISSGFTAALMGSLWPELYGSRHIGAIRSVSFALMVFASAAGPGLVGVLIDAEFNFDHQLLAMAGYCALMTAVLTAAGRKLRER
ncbi:MFS transporter [Roseibium sp.]|uniref:MFS transporter n=1 Tax=Roseibium sp. TaxID=1936156 RepID=UPI003B528129